MHIILCLTRMRIRVGLKIRLILVQMVTTGVHIVVLVLFSTAFFLLTATSCSRILHRLITTRGVTRIVEIHFLGISVIRVLLIVIIVIIIMSLHRTIHFILILRLMMSRVCLRLRLRLRVGHVCAGLGRLRHGILRLTIHIAIASVRTKCRFRQRHRVQILDNIHLVRGRQCRQIGQCALMRRMLLIAVRQRIVAHQLSVALHIETVERRIGVGAELNIVSVRRHIHINPDLRRLSLRIRVGVRVRGATAVNMYMTTTVQVMIDIAFEFMTLLLSIPKHTSDTHERQKA
mmetsp:Transcript_798/g.1547  ORF Transcript_798/g.1547 Transcript_798/m.1547 type:complete len:289 (+) Transcript_798:525-1391(+)